MGWNNFFGNPVLENLSPIGLSRKLLESQSHHEFDALQATENFFQQNFPASGKNEALHSNVLIIILCQIVLLLFRYLHSFCKSVEPDQLGKCDTTICCSKENSGCFCA